jgi:hypothetical protein
MTQPTVSKARTVGNGDLLLIFVALGLLGVCVVAFRDSLLPPRFSYDGIRIQQIASGLVSTPNDPSYGRVGAAYRAMGLANDSFLAGLLGFAAYLACTAFACRQLGWRVTWPWTLASTVGISLAAVYLGFYSKDVFVLAVTALLMIDRRRIATYGAVLAMIAYALLFRSYWLVIAGLFCLFWLTVRFGRRRLRLRLRARLVIAVVLGLCLVAAAYSVVNGVEIQSIRTGLNAERIGSPDASSTIPTFIPGSGLPLQLANLVVTLAFLVIPVPLLALGGLYYLAIAILIAGLWIAFLGISTARGSSRSTSLPHWRRASLIAYPVAFVATQAVFEPDYGSALRHLTPVLPCMLLALGLFSDARRAQVESNVPGTRTSA